MTLRAYLFRSLGQHVVRRGQGEPLPAVLDEPRDEVIALLGGGRAGAIDERRALLAFVELGIDVERLAPRDDDVLDGVAHRAGDAAEHHVHVVALDQLAHVVHRHRLVRRRVLDEELERAPQDAALGIDVGDHHLRDVGVGIAGEADGPGQVRGDPDLDGVGLSPRRRDDEAPGARGDRAHPERALEKAAATRHGIEDGRPVLSAHDSTPFSRPETSGAELHDHDGDHEY